MNAIDSYRSPPFMHGTMLAVESPGYQWNGEPPVDLTTDEVLDSQNPWFVVAGVFERAKRGNHRHSDRLLRILRLSNEAALCHDAEVALSLTGPRAYLRMLRLLLGGKNAAEALVLESIYGVLSHVHELWVIPELLDIYLTDRVDQFQSVSWTLSHMLEDAPGEIDEAKEDDAAYRALVMSRFEDLREQFGTDEVAVTCGRPVEVDAVARRLRNLILKEPDLSGEAMYTRMLLEAFTGLDCRAFYKGDRFQPLSAVAVLEEFLDHADLSGYRPGVRYFFGHPVPAE